MEPVPHHYVERLNKVTDYIEKHIDRSWTLDELAVYGNFSKFHFSRIFQAMTGESLFQFVLRRRLERSASLLVSRPGEKLADIAQQCGFTDISIFSRNFKKYYRVSPSSYKKAAIKKSNYSQIAGNHGQIAIQIDMYFCSTHQTSKWTTNMEIVKNAEVKTLPGKTLAYVRNTGPYKGNNRLYQQHRAALFAWAGARDLLAREDFAYLVLYHDNPSVALTDNLRMSLCVTIPENTVTEGLIGRLGLETAKYLVCSCELTASDFPKAYEWIYGHWFPQSGYIPDDKPYFELYPEQPQGEIFKVDFCIPVKTL